MGDGTVNIFSGSSAPNGCASRFNRTELIPEGVYHQSETIEFLFHHLFFIIVKTFVRIKKK